MRMVRQLREELGQSYGTMQRVADRLGCGMESFRTDMMNDESGSPPCCGLVSKTFDRHRY